MIIANSNNALLIAAMLLVGLLLICPGYLYSQSGAESENLELPLRGAFYYSWYPQTWTVGGKHVFYEPELGYYSSDDAMENSRMPIMQMPNVEKLAEEGMKFRNAYCSPQCSPSGVCIQTGQSTPRNGFTVYQGKSADPYYQIDEEYKYFPLVPNVADFEIDEDALTIAEVLKPLGYVSAHIGKWHMRGDPGEVSNIANQDPETHQKLYDEINTLGET